jgi:hypothetical protein
MNWGALVRMTQVPSLECNLCARECVPSWPVTGCANKILNKYGSNTRCGAARKVQARRHAELDTKHRVIRTRRYCNDILTHLPLECAALAEALSKPRRYERRRKRM